MALITSLPSGPVALSMTTLALRQSPWGRARLISGMMISAASEETTLPTAPPTITAMARASTLFLSRNSLKPLIIECSLCACAKEFREALHRGFQNASPGGVADAETTFASLAERDTGRQADSGFHQQITAERERIVKPFNSREEIKRS